MKIPFFLTVSKGKSVRATKNRPNTGWDEISIGMTLELPDRIFDKPSLTATVTVPEEVLAKDPINAQVIDNVKEAIQQTTGLQVMVHVDTPKEGE